MSTRDYKPRARARNSGGNSRARRPRNGPRRWPWFVGGFVCGLLVAYVAYLREYSPETLQLIASQSALRDEASRKGAQPAEGNGKPRFEFYTLLPEMEMAVPERELEAAAEREQRRAEAARREREQAAATAAPVSAQPPAATTAPAPADQPAESEPSKVAPAPDQDSVYMLQVASFTHAEDADRLRARLTLMGLTTSVQTVSVDGTQTYFRVRVGPYADITRLNDARTRLREHDLEPLVLKVRG